MKVSEGNKYGALSPANESRFPRFGTRFNAESSPITRQTAWRTRRWLERSLLLKKKGWERAEHARASAASLCLFFGTMTYHACGQSNRPQTGAAAWGFAGGAATIEQAGRGRSGLVGATGADTQA